MGAVLTRKRENARRFKSSGAGGVFQAELHFAAPAPGVQLQPARKVKVLVARVFKGGAKRAVESAKGDALDPRRRR